MSAPATLLPLPSGCERTCRACPHRQWSMEDSLAQKSAYLSEMLSPWVDQLQPVRSVEEVERWGYRSRARLVALWRGWCWDFGLESRDEFISIPQCPVHAPWINAALAVLAEVLPPADRFPLRFVVANGGFMTLVLKAREVTAPAWLTPETGARLTAAGLRGLWLHLNPAAGARMFGKRGWHHLWGAADRIDANGCHHGPSVFQQVLPSLHAEALESAATFLEPKFGDWLADLYCGYGNTLKRWAQRIGTDDGHLIGVEADGESVRFATRNVPGALILQGLCAQRLPQLRAWDAGMRSTGGGEPLAYVNPPRLGLEEEVARWLAAEFRPMRLAYLSCSAGTLRRDLEHLASSGYRVERIEPFDFFPQTIHVETLTLLRRES